MDPLLSRTRGAAAQLLRDVSVVPADQRIAALDSALWSYDPRLPREVRRMADTLQHRGFSVNAAMQEGLARALADAFINKMTDTGLLAERSVGLGALGDDPGTTILNMTRGLLCSAAVPAMVTDLIGRHEGRDAATITAAGFTVSGAAANCGALNPAAVPPPAPPPAPEPRTSYAVPLAVGAGLLLLVGAVAYATRPKIKANRRSGRRRNR